MNIPCGCNFRPAPFTVTHSQDTPHADPPPRRHPALRNHATRALPGAPPLPRPGRRPGPGRACPPAWPAPPTSLGPLPPARFSTTETPTPYKAVTTYNNFYELGTDKATRPRTSTGSSPPWTLRIEGLVNKPRSLGIDELLKLAPLEERIYRMRCVEGWSMVIPWVGIPLGSLLKLVEPQGSAKYVEFVSHYDRATMTRGVLDWPYTEACASTRPATR
jgi:DMSO/TMAO reductase YedYZ molybdopterin-dependent catalytic subunit